MSHLQGFQRLEALGGVLLIVASAAAMVLANSGGAGWYDALTTLPVEIRAGSHGLEKPLLLWINDGLMAVFFLLIGLELKREVLEGELSSVRQVILPCAAALGGIAVPVAIYALCNSGDPVALRGWAIPAATDIAFALGMLALLGPRVPAGLKTFLMTLAVFDDIAAIVIIAVFYSGDLEFGLYGAGFVALGLLLAMNQLGLKRLGPYLIVGAVLWLAVLKSGVHATLAGVLVGLAIPARGTDALGNSPLGSLATMLHPYVAVLILPAFAFVNAGVSLRAVGWEGLVHPVTLGIALGLIAGKTAGVFGLAWLVVRLGYAKLPAGTSWPVMFGVSVLAGIGFTMSLFIGTLAFENQTEAHGLSVAIRLGVLGGSLVAAVTGLLLLRITLPRPGRAGVRA